MAKTKLSVRQEKELRAGGRSITLTLSDVKRRAADLGLWRTMHALDEATEKVGWEIAELLGDRAAEDHLRGKVRYAKVACGSCGWHTFRRYTPRALKKPCLNENCYAGTSALQIVYTTERRS